MMITPCRRRSFQSHREYYSNVAARVDSRWKDGYPGLHKGKLMKNKRRATVSCLITSSPKAKAHSEEDEVFSNASVINESNENNETHNAADLSGVKSLDASICDVVKSEFKDLFLRLENYVQLKTITQVESDFVQSQMKVLRDNAAHIDFMINELMERKIRLEKFLENRNNHQDQHWAEWNY